MKIPKSAERNVQFKMGVWESLKRHVTAADDRESYVKVGIVGNGANATHESGATMAEIATIHEYGAPGAGLPERSFIRRGLEFAQPKIESLIVNLAQRFVAGDITWPQALGILGAFASSQVKFFVTSGQVEPKESPATTAAKNARAGQPLDAKTTTLVDTGRLVQAITWKVWLKRARDSQGRFIKVEK